MWRSVVVLALFVVPALVGPAAFAQDGVRDPFEPLVSETTGAPGGAAAPAEGGAASPAPATTAPAAQDEGMPSTGSPASSWLAIGYVLIALGAAAVVIARSASAPGAPLSR